MNAVSRYASGRSNSTRFANNAASSAKVRNFRKFTGLVVSCGTLCLYSLQGQTAPAGPASKNPTSNDVVTLPSFTVSAQKVARPIQEVPLAITAIDSQKVEEFKLFNAQDVQNLSPGLDVKMTDPRNPIPSMRGITFNPDSGTTAAVDVYWNEVAVGPDTAFRSLYDVGQIEVLRGPQGTLRGRSSPGGAITIATRKPDLNNFGISLDQSLSDQHLINSQFALNVPIIKGVLGFRLAGLYDSNSAGGVRNIVTGKDNSSHTRSFRATLEWKPNDNFDVTFVHQYLDQVLVGFAAVQGSPVYSKTLPKNLNPFDRISVSPGDATYEDRPVLDSLTAALKLPGRHELTATVGYQDTKSHMKTEYVNLANIIPGYTDPQILDNLGSTQTYELRFSSVRHTTWNYIFGVYYESSDSTVRVRQPAAKLWFDNANPYVSISPVPRAPDYTVPLDLAVTGTGSYRGLFTTHTVQVSKKVRLEAGVRYQQIKSDSRSADPALGIDGSTSRDEKPTTGTGSLSFQFTPRILSYVTIGRSYRPGGESLRIDSAELEKYLHYQPEKSNGVELGFKSTWYDNRIQLNADVFYQKFKGYISHSGYVNADSNFDGVSDNSYGISFNGDAETKGVEVGLTAALPYRAVFGFDFSYADARWTDARSPANVYNAAGLSVFNTPGEQVSFVSMNGKRLGDTPRLTLSSRFEWSKRFSSHEVFARSLFRYNSDRELIATPDSHIGGSGTLDLFVGLRNPESKWSITFWVKNALNREIVINRSPQTNIGRWHSGYTAVRVAPERELGVTGTYRF